MTDSPSRMTDEQIKQATIAHFVKQGVAGETADDWSESSIYMMWFRDMGLPYARAILAAAAGEPSDSILIRLHRPEGYEDVHPEIILDDLNINPAFRPELVAAAGERAPLQGAEAGRAVAQRMLANPGMRSILQNLKDGAAGERVDAETLLRDLIQAHREWDDAGENDHRLAELSKAFDDALERAAAHVAGERVDAPAEPTWRCFHCDETFADKDSAAEHFGTHEMQQPACTIDVAEYRRMEETHRSHCEEDTDLHRELHRKDSERTLAVRRAEDEGYARGLRDVPVGIFDAIAHGTDEHRAWLKQALEDYCAGRPVRHEFAASPADAPQPAKAADALTDEQIKARCAQAGIQWIEPDPEDSEGGLTGSGFPGSFDMVSMPEMRALLAAKAACPAPAEPSEAVTRIMAAADAYRWQKLRMADVNDARAELERIVQFALAASPSSACASPASRQQAMAELLAPMSPEAGALFSEICELGRGKADASPASLQTAIEEALASLESGMVAGAEYTLREALAAVLPEPPKGGA